MEIPDLTPVDIMMWLYILCECSKKDSDSVTISHKIVALRTRVSIDFQKVAITKLRKIGWLSTNYAKIRTTITRTEREIEREIEKEREGEVKETVPDGTPSPEDLLETWNANRGSLPAGIGISAARRRAAKVVLADEPDLGVWGGVITRIASSAFCTGTNNRGWRATFDWLLKPDTRMKVLEGKYDTRDPKREAWEAKQREEAQLAELMKGWGVNGE
jgi:hypothetical protein